MQSSHTAQQENRPATLKASSSAAGAASLRGETLEQASGGSSEQLEEATRDDTAAASVTITPASKTSTGANSAAASVQVGAEAQRQQRELHYSLVFNSGSSCGPALARNCAPGGGEEIEKHVSSSSSSGGSGRGSNSSSSSSDQQHTTPLESDRQTLESVSLNNGTGKLEPRIKVTLSTPRNSHDQPAAEPILFEAATYPERGAVASEAGNNRRRQSTAPLIGADNLKPADSGTNQAPGAPAKPPLASVVRCRGTRANQEAELRRLASQRRKVAPVSTSAPGAGTGAGANTGTGRGESEQSAAVEGCLGGQKSQTQKQQVASQENIDQRKQLAIFINGKIRSNSIFCQSNSANSFSSLLSRFTQHKQQQQQQISGSGQVAAGTGAPVTAAAAGAKQSERGSLGPLSGDQLLRARCPGGRQCELKQQQPGGSYCCSKCTQSSRSSGLKGSGSSRRSKNDARNLVSNLRSSAQTFLLNYLPLLPAKRRPSASGRQQEEAARSPRAEEKCRLGGGPNESTETGAPLIVKSRLSGGGANGNGEENYVASSERDGPGRRQSSPATTGLAAVTGGRHREECLAHLDGKCCELNNCTTRGSPHLLAEERQRQAGERGGAGTSTSQTQTTSYKLNPSSMFLRKAMRYYRLWIYCTNITILLGTLIFILSAIYVTSDYRFRLIVSSGQNAAATLSVPAGNGGGGGGSSSREGNLAKSHLPNAGLTSESLSNKQEDYYVGKYAHTTTYSNLGAQQTTNTKTNQQHYDIYISYSEPSVLLAYAVIIMQAGVLQAIGCFGAIRMKERWIQAFWYMILALTVFDVLFLVHWLNRYDLIVKSFHQHMSARLNQHYGRPSSFEGLFLNHHHTHASPNFALSAGENKQNSTSLQPNLNSSLSSDFTGLGPGEELDLKLDKILTEIIDKIQADSGCCGISSSLDYKQSKWRHLKLKQLGGQLNLTSPSAGALLSRVPLVPASCCRLNNRPPPPAASQSINGAPEASKLEATQVGETGQQQQERQRKRPRKPVIPDDSQVERPPRVPAWSPSMVVEDLWGAGSSSRPASRQSEGAWRGPEAGAKDELDNELADLLDTRWLGTRSDSVASQAPNQAGDNETTEPDYDDVYEGLSNQQRRLLAKQDNFNLPPPGEQSAPAGRKRRWALESKADKDQRLLTRLMEALDKSDDDDDDDDEDEDEDQLEDDDDDELEEDKKDSTEEDEDEDVEREGEKPGPAWAAIVNEARGDNGLDVEEPQGGQNGKPGVSRGRLELDKLANLRQSLFAGAAGVQGPPTDNGIQESNSTSALYRPANFKWPNELGLSYEQYKILENYLLLGAKVKGEEDGGGGGGGRARRSPPIRATPGNSNDLRPNLARRQASTNQSQQLLEEQQTRQMFAQQLAERLRRDPDTGCAPRSYFDQATIYTHGCQPAIKAWLDSSAHILIVTGFCVLTVLKFCSVVLLRLEIKEMIHKIRVLKGMATEYNALHDLEAYLPRPSVCAQAAELTPSGVAAALAATSPSVSIGQNLGPVHRLGGSFSEAVAAATAAHCQQASAAAAAAAAAVAATPPSQQLGGGGLAGSGRAASMKAMAAMSSMLAPTSAAVGGGLCARSSSTSSAHLHAAASLLGQKQALSLRSDLFQPSSLMSRRHTAVSVCPAAAATAAAAAHHLMSRRGTYVANPLFGASPAAAAAAVAVATPSSSASHAHAGHHQQHRHSAHTVLAGHCASMATAVTNSDSSTLLKPQQSISSRQLRSPQHLGDHCACGASECTRDLLQQGQQNSMEHQSSVESNQLPSCQRRGQNQQEQVGRHSAGSHQLLSLVYPFKRQSSGGTQSACNFSLDLTPPLVAESRRSIH